jgi:hypothetical protein
MERDKHPKRAPLLRETVPLPDPKLETVQVRAASGGVITLLVKTVFWSIVAVSVLATILNALYRPRLASPTPQELHQWHNSLRTDPSRDEWGTEKQTTNTNPNRTKR